MKAEEITKAHVRPNSIYFSPLMDAITAALDEKDERVRELVGVAAEYASEIRATMLDQQKAVVDAAFKYLEGGEDG